MQELNLEGRFTASALHTIKAQTAIMMLTMHGRAICYRIDGKMRLVVCIGSSVVEWGLKILVTQVRFLLDAQQKASTAI